MEEDEEDGNWYLEEGSCSNRSSNTQPWLSDEGVGVGLRDLEETPVATTEKGPLTKYWQKDS